jgi:alpha-tubulin suppressor-like RCC1 family protein
MNRIYSNLRIQKLQFLIGNLLLVKYLSTKDKKKCFNNNDKTRKVYSWGNGLYGQLGISEEKMLSIPQEVIFPEEINPYKIYASFDSSACLTTDSKLYVWGKCSEGSIGKQNMSNIINFNSPTMSPYQDTFSSPIVNISLSKEHSGLVDEAGNVYMWGINNFGKLGFESVDLDKKLRIKKPKTIYEKIEFNKVTTNLKDINIIQISCGFNHTV